MEARESIQKIVPNQVLPMIIIKGETVLTHGIGCECLVVQFLFATTNCLNDPNQTTFI